MTEVTEHIHTRASVNLYLCLGEKNHLTRELGLDT